MVIIGPGPVIGKSKKNEVNRGVTWGNQKQGEVR